MKKIVVFGSINTDLVISTSRIPENGETLKGNNFFTNHGGKGANQAVAAVRLGGNVSMIGCLGNDNFGQNAIEALNHYGVNTKAIEMIDKVPSGIAIIIKIDGDNRIILDSGANKYLKVDHLQSYLDQEINQGAIFITQLENDINETIKALALAKEKQMITIFNPAPAVKLESSVYKSVDILVVNQSEAQILSGIYPVNRDDCEKAFRIFNSLGVKTLVITLGKTGSIVISKESVKQIEGLIVQAVDTTGAGDAYIGALAYGIANDLSISESAELANKVSALAVMKEGAQSAMPTIKEVNEKFNIGGIK
ncbi:MAG: ribokinase [Haloplasmataceae bacterium]|nr:ribokinase [Haloplasmataceae bacterium]